MFNTSTSGTSFLPPVAGNHLHFEGAEKSSAAAWRLVLRFCTFSDCSAGIQRLIDQLFHTSCFQSETSSFCPFCLTVQIFRYLPVYIMFRTRSSYQNISAIWTSLVLFCAPGSPQLCCSFPRSVWPRPDWVEQQHRSQSGLTSRPRNKEEKLREHQGFWLVLVSLQPAV